jgi:molybdopterin-guanine dinucleotide biosynthesis protein B
MKIFSVIGLHHSGKTTAVENLIKYLKARNLTVSSIKDIHQAGFTMEKEGSNSHRHLTAGASCVFARGDQETYLIWKKQLQFNEMLAHLNTEWVIIEGMQDVKLPKILAAKDLAEVEKLFEENVFAITGQFSENFQEYKGIPALNAITDVEKLGDLVLKNVGVSPTTIPKISIKFNHEEVFLNDWVQQLSTDIITSFCRNLRGYKTGDKISIVIESS